MKTWTAWMLATCLLLTQACALADGLALDYRIQNEFPSALYGKVRLRSYAYDYPGYISADGMGSDVYSMKPEDYVQIITKSASVWASPKTNSKKLGSVSHGEKLLCEEDENGSPAEEGDFFVVRYKGKTGYVNKAYAVVSPLEIVLMESNVPAYIAPDVNAKCVGSLAKHTRYTVIGMYDDFYIINLRGAAAAFISKKTQCYDSRFEDFYFGLPTEEGTIIRDTELRTGPGEGYAKITDVQEGDTFEVYDMINAWHMVKYVPKGSDDVIFAFVYCNDIDVPIANG